MDPDALTIFILASTSPGDFLKVSLSLPPFHPVTNFRILRITDPWRIFVSLTENDHDLIFVLGISLYIFDLQKKIFYGKKKI